jgi:hypothetical protein
MRKNLPPFFTLLSGLFCDSLVEPALAYMLLIHTVMGNWQQTIKINLATLGYEFSN